MLNPDGAEAYERVNGQGIDINRDALRLATPEGRILKRIRDEYNPMLGLNLHDQGRMTTVGDTGRLATTSVLAANDNFFSEGPICDCSDNLSNSPIGRMRCPLSLSSNGKVSVPGGNVHSESSAPNK